MPLTVDLTNEEKVRITCRPTTSTGNPAAVDGGLRATLMSGEGTNEPDPSDSLSVWLNSGANPGDATWICEVDADVGTGVTLLQDVVVLKVKGAQAVNLGMVAGSPVPK